MTTIRIGSRELDKWMHQNAAEPTGDYIYGYDTFIAQTKRGIAAIYELFRTADSSEYLIKFAPGMPSESEEADRVYTEFFENMEW